MQGALLPTTELTASSVKIEKTILEQLKPTSAVGLAAPMVGLAASAVALITGNEGVRVFISGRWLYSPVASWSNFVQMSRINLSKQS